MIGNGITLDDRVGSAHYLQFLPGAEVARLDFGDACWMAYDGRLVGVEIKKLLDALSCMNTGRLADFQVPGMRSLYDISYLVIEGTYRSEPTSGILQRWVEFPSSRDTVCGKWVDATAGRRRRMYGEFERWLTTIEHYGGVCLRQTPDASATAALLLSLYQWHQREDHKSFNVMHEAQGNGAELSRPTMLRRIAALLPRIGWERSAEIVKRFKSVREMVEAPTEKWLWKGQIGHDLAEKIWRALNE